jgi:hypothetical protein
MTAAEEPATARRYSDRIRRVRKQERRQRKAAGCVRSPDFAHVHGGYACCFPHDDRSKLQEHGLHGGFGGALAFLSASGVTKLEGNRCGVTWGRDARGGSRGMGCSDYRQLGMFYLLIF